MGLQAPVTFSHFYREPAASHRQLLRRTSCLSDQHRLDVLIMFPDCAMIPLWKKNTWIKLFQQQKELQKKKVQSSFYLSGCMTVPACWLCGSKCGGEVSARPSLSPSPEPAGLGCSWKHTQTHTHCLCYATGPMCEVCPPQWLGCRWKQTTVSHDFYTDRPPILYLCWPAGVLWWVYCNTRPRITWTKDTLGRVYLTSIMITVKGGKLRNLMGTKGGNPKDEDPNQTICIQT